MNLATKRFMSCKQKPNSTRRMQLLFIAGLLVLAACSSQSSSQKRLADSGPELKNGEHANTNIVFDSEFSTFSSKQLTNQDLRKQYENLKWAQLFDRVSLQEDDGHNVLAVEYPKGSVGPHQGGAQFVINLPPKESYTLSYSVKFKKGFDFRLGGKLPGLTSGGEKWTGGTRPLKGEGFSARLMWREGGIGELYLYYIDMNGKWGESIDFNHYVFETEKWYNIRQHIKINDPNERNAELYIWINDELVLSKTNFRLRVDESPKIDSLYFSTFHGGNQPKWGPNVDSTAYFGDFVVIGE